jgi:hypothetical protein
VNSWGAASSSGSMPGGVPGMAMIIVLRPATALGAGAALLPAGTDAAGPDEVAGPDETGTGVALLPHAATSKTSIAPAARNLLIRLSSTNDMTYGCAEISAGLGDLGRS